MSTAPQVDGGSAPAGALPRPLRRVPTPPPLDGGLAPVPRRRGARALLSGVFVLLASVGAMVVVLAALARAFRP